MPRSPLVLALLAAAGCHRAAPMLRRPPAAGTAIALCAAYPYDPAKTHAVVIQPDGTAGEIVTFHGARYNVHRSDCLELAGASLRAIAWRDTGATAYVGIELAGPAAAQLAARCERRASQDDAVYIDGQLESVSEYPGVLHTLWLSGAPEIERALFARLTGTQPGSAGR